jgi:hypothetical protein
MISMTGDFLVMFDHRIANDNEAGQVSKKMSAFEPQHEVTRRR